ncbi:MAG: glycosyltransferase family 2 protein [Nitrospirae bacterium]|nr:glycosyltransferase family 2 protein [Nitrospirota bacterium]
MKVSVIVTTYNRPSYLKKVLEGLAFQKTLPDEVIVADDGSGAETEDVVRGFAEKASFPVIHVWHEDKGRRAAKTRNEAIKKSVCGYIVILDDDCIPDRRFVYDHIRLAEKGCFVQGKRVIVGRKASGAFSARDANSLPALLKLAAGFSISNSHHILRMPFFPARRNRKLKGIMSCNMGFFRDDIFAVNGFNEAFVGWGREDSELGVRLFNYGIKRKEHLFRAICYHLWHPSYPRESLQRNDMILEETIKSGVYFSPYGIIKKH